MNLKMIGALLAVALPLVSGSVFADQMIISYRSGKTQTISLDERIEQVKDIRLVGNADSISEKVKELLTEKPRSEEQGAKKEHPPAKQKSQPKIQWAPPVSD